QAPDDLFPAWYCQKPVMGQRAKPVIDGGAEAMSTSAPLAPPAMTDVAEETMTGFADGIGQHNEPVTPTQSMSVTGMTGMTGNGAYTPPLVSEANVEVHATAVGPLPEYITTASQLDAVVPSLCVAPLLAVDTETTGLDPLRDRLRLIQFALPDRVVVVDAF